MGANVKRSGLKVDHTLITKIKRNFVDYVTGTYKKEFRLAILDLISKGISPVAGKRKFKPYSKTYREAIERGYYGDKRKTPVNMKLSGEMLDSLSLKANKESVTISFDDPVSEFHNDLGAGKSKVIRRLLPTNQGERFSKVIDDKVRDALRFSVETTKRKG